MGSDGLQVGMALFIHISIHAPRMGSDVSGGHFSARPVISIHAPRMGSDSCGGVRRACRAISIHAPRMGSDASYCENKANTC